MSTADEHSTTGTKATGLWTSVSLLVLAVFFVGCGCLTMAEILLGSNNSLSAVMAIVGLPLVLVGGVVLALRCRLGPPPGPGEGHARSASAMSYTRD